MREENINAPRGDDKRKGVIFFNETSKLQGKLLNYVYVLYIHMTAVTPYTSTEELYEGESIDGLFVIV